MTVLSMALIEAGHWALLLVTAAFAFLTRYWLGFAYLHAGLLFVLLYLAIVRIPLMLNWSSNLYGTVFTRVVFLQIFSIFTYAICYVSAAGFADNFESFWDAMYFSATTWTTLGYGDISPTGGIRLLTSLEAFTGLSTLPLLASVIWLYCERRLRTRTLQEQDVEGYELRLTSAGVFVEIENDRTREEQRTRDRIKLRTCPCGHSQPFIEKYFDIVGRLTPLPRFHVVCKSCGAFSKSKLNAYLAAWTWNNAKHR